MSDVTQAAAAGILSDLDAEEAAAAEASPPSSPVEPVAEATPPQVTVPEVDLDPELPPDILMDLEPDSDDESDEPAYEDPPWESTVPKAWQESESDDEYVDPQVAHLRAELAKEKKRAEYEKNLRLKGERKKWEAEAAKFFPLADPTTIKADSRRAFRREAQAQHTRMKDNPQFQRFLEAERARVRAEAQAAWGTPTSGPGAGTPDSKQFEDELREARRAGRLDKTIHALMKRDGVGR